MPKQQFQYYGIADDTFAGLIFAINAQAKIGYRIVSVNEFRGDRPGENSYLGVIMERPFTGEAILDDIKKVFKA